ncbi:protein shisa-6-like [Oncorhynchus nerka]|uniref:protein shisa-6-like n=1 Tax=Oncorhynchus nerka TaxID=8023 RepID=UPI0031B8A982
MGIRHLLLLLIYLDPLSVFCAATGGKKVKTETKRTPKAKEANITAAVPTAAPQKNTTKDYDMCTGYYDVSGQFDREFACNNTVHRYCCGSCFLRFCCQEKEKRVDQSSCKNYNTPDWVKTPPPSPASTGQPFDPSMDQTNTAVYITCGIIAFILVVGVSAKVAYDKATEPPQEMNIHRALADILRQQGPIPISQYDCENFAAMNGSPKDNTPQQTSSKNHYTPVHQSKSNHGLQYGKESIRSSGGHDLHTFISSGFVTLGRGQPKGNGGPSHAPIHIDGAVVELVESFKFLGLHITKDLSWSTHTNTVVKRARQCLFTLRRPKIFVMGPQILKQFYSCTIESILTGCITAWYGNCSASDQKVLQRVVRVAQYITGAELPAIQDQAVSEEGPKNVQRLQPTKS